jgi:hypothetical protein
MEPKVCTSARSTASRLYSVLLLTLLMPSGSLSAQAPKVPPAMAYTVDITDLSQKFVDFYNSSVAEHADPDRRWELWKSKYNFAAVPNISAGQKMAREQLDAAWAKYPEAMSQIRLGATALTPSPQERLTKVAELLGVQGPIRIRLIAFVGTFRRNAFSMGVKDGVSTIAIPLEDSAQDHALGMTHEFTHAVQMQEGGWNGQSVASTIFAEGLAMRVTEHLNPGFPENIYTGSPAWLEKCKASLPQVLNELKEHSADSGAEAVSKFTYGTGTAGISREVYCGGWFVVGRMLSDGASFSTLGRMTQAEAEARVAAMIDSLLTSSAPAAISSPR